MRGNCWKALLGAHTQLSCAQYLATVEYGPSALHRIIVETVSRSFKEEERKDKLTHQNKLTRVLSVSVHLAHGDCWRMKTCKTPRGGIPSGYLSLCQNVAGSNENKSAYDGNKDLLHEEHIAGMQAMAGILLRECNEFDSTSLILALRLNHVPLVS